MKVIIVEVTRAANTFGRTHLAKIREAYAQIAGIVARAQAAGVFREQIAPEFAALAFYGLIEQVLTSWIFDRRRARGRGPRAGEGADRGDDLPRAGAVMNATGSDRPARHSALPGPRSLIESARMTESPLVKRLIWSGLLAGTGALASIAGVARGDDDLAASVRRRPARVSDSQRLRERRADARRAAIPRLRRRKPPTITETPEPPTVVQTAAPVAPTPPPTAIAPVTPPIPVPPDSDAPRGLAYDRPKSWWAARLPAGSCSP